MRGQLLRTHRVALVLGLTGLVAAGCYNISDEDRCLDGFTYDPQENVCVENVDAGVDAQVDAQVDAETSADASGVGPISGLWDDCETSGDCTGDADHCAYSDMGQVGYCTVTDCTAGSCPDGFWCCDCTAVEWPVMCADETNTMISTFCTCPVP